MNVEQLRRELSRVRIRGRLASRILKEFQDHLSIDPDDDLGEPAAIARQFADELGTSLARSAALKTFAALVVCGVAMLAALPNVGDTYNWVNYNTGIGPLHISWFNIGIFLAVFIGQISVAAGGLALLGATRLARMPVISAAEARTLRRRAAVAWGAGAITVMLLALMALVVPTAYGARWEVAVLIAAGACGAALLTALPSIARAAWVKPAADGATPDLLVDLTPFLPARTTRLLTPWRCAFVLATAAAAALTAVGIVDDQIYRGMLRGVAEAVLCLAGFSLLGRYLGMTRPAAELHAE
jgi:hypothetical protein